MNIEKPYLDENFGNTDLANAYWSAILFADKYQPSKIALRFVSHVFKRISNSRIDIPQFYRQHGSLRNLQVMGIGDRTKAVLETILNGECKGLTLQRDETTGKIIPLAKARPASPSDYPNLKESEDEIRWYIVR